MAPLHTCGPRPLDANGAHTALSNETPRASSHTPQATEPTILAKPLFPEDKCHAFAAAERRRPHLPGNQPLDHFPQTVLSSAETACPYFPAFIISASFAFTAGSAVVTIVEAVPSDPTALRL